MPEKLIRCVKAIQKKGGPSAKYAWAICIKQLKIKRVGKHKWKKIEKGKRR